MVRTFQVYDPKVYSYLIFKVREGKESSLADSLEQEFTLIKDFKTELSLKGGWAVIELMREVSPGGKVTSEVSPELLKIKYDESERDRKRVMDKAQPFLQKDTKPMQYTLFVCGSHDRIWMKTYSDMSFLYKEGAEGMDLLQTNISYLNRSLNMKGEVFVNTVKHGKATCSVYIFGKPQKDPNQLFNSDMLLEMDLSDLKSGPLYGDAPYSLTEPSPYAGAATPDRRLYQMHQNYLISLLAIKSRLSDLFLHQAQFFYLKGTELKTLQEHGESLKERIYSLQKDINDHMQRYVPKTKETKDKKTEKKKDFMDKETFEKEKELLTTASVDFSLVSDVENQIMRQMSSLHDMVVRVHETTRVLGLEGEEASVESSDLNLGSILTREIDKESRKLEILLQELSRSRDILSSTIEVLRTFIDTRQREISEDMSRLMNVLFLVFACIGLADSLGNFVILAVEYIFLKPEATTAEVLSASSLGLMITLIPLLIGVVFLVIYFNRRR